MKYSIAIAHQFRMILQLIYCHFAFFMCFLVNILQHELVTDSMKLAISWNFPYFKAKFLFMPLLAP